MSSGKDNSSFGQFDALTREKYTGLLVLGSNAALKFVNPSACELLGCANEEDLKDRWQALKPSLGFDKDLSPTFQSRSLEVKLSINNKTRFLYLETYAFHEEAFTGYLVLINGRQIGEALLAELLLASQLRVQKHLHGALAHDLRAPLNAIQITLELLTEVGGRGVDPSSQQRYIIVLKEELARLNRSLTTLLDNRIPSLNAAPEEFDLRVIVEEVAALLKTQARRHRVDLVYQLPDREVRVNGQRDRLKQALLNVAINALAGKPGGGRLQIDMRVQDAAVNIIVRNDGSGVANTLPETSDNDMSLSVARLVMESHEGHIQSVQGSDGPGYSLTMPLAKTPEPSK